ncbi:restriction endonuclease subunit S, partial [Bifidobacterium longum subsp. longum]
NVVEQNHLGNFFADLDRLITLHQRKRLWFAK